MKWGGGREGKPSREAGLRAHTSVSQPLSEINLPLLHSLRATFPASSATPGAAKALQENHPQMTRACSAAETRSLSLSHGSPQATSYRRRMADGNHLTDLSGWRAECPETRCSSHGDSPSPASRAKRRPPNAEIKCLKCTSEKCATVYALSHVLCPTNK